MADRRAAAWLIWLGSLLVLSQMPLEHLFLKLWSAGHPYMAPMIVDPLRSAFVHSTSYQVSLPGFFTAWALLLTILLPSLLSTILNGGPRRDRATLVTFTAFGALLMLVGHAASQPGLIFSRPLIEIPPWLGSALPALGIVGVFGAWVIGVPSRTLAPWARRLLAVDLLWIVLLQWNALGMSPRYFPGWIGGAGALMILAGELLAARDSRFQIRDSPR